ncbi:uncharacterized protein C5L36_0A05350 [Pichia kudriavzevii]|uniref:Cytochrome b5 heme-binding domain-containing protein n=2 Tax=Pichia kudriavzevii TaxID=4909 RepID=A0A099NWK4_PICKU|nr:uncharacterized protein C5L36_0A05350 [Pichia kudriavzevii]AWU73939.1 hypothetical protein C5L36_0A05350 [Pichia kudriavzevii]KGK36965.1 hypothetical protein JL09_g3873 [Pichia kudriavzevii]
MDSNNIKQGRLVNENRQEQRKPKTVFIRVPSNVTHENVSQNQRLFPMAGSPQIASANKREKVRLAPHHSAMDWERRKKTTNVRNLHPSEFPLRVTKEELKKHRNKDDCWVAFGDKIYNITAYLDYHPGGVDILLKNAGRDCTALFMKYHRWVNYERILDGCFIGFLVT